MFKLLQSINTAPSKLKFQNYHVHKDDLKQELS